MFFDIVSAWRPSKFALLPIVLFGLLPIVLKVRLATLAALLVMRSAPPPVILLHWCDGVLVVRASHVPLAVRRVIGRPQIFGVIAPCERR